MESNNLPNGFYFKLPREGAPDFVLGSISIKKDDFIKYLQDIEGEWLNLDCKKSKAGNGYAEVNNWKPDSDQKNKNTSEDNSVDDLSWIK